MLHLSASDIRRAVPLEALLDPLQEALRALSSGQVIQPPRQVLSLSDADASGALGLMPSAGAGLLGAKIVAVFPRNPSRGLDAHQGLVILLDSKTGQPLVVADGATITGLRTAAVSALATRALGPRDPHVLTVFGAGVQARAHLDALSSLHKYSEIRIWSRSQPSAEQLAGEYSKGPDPHCRNLRVFNDPREAARGAQVLCLCTAASEPFLRIDDVDPGAHLNAIGACRPGFREIELKDRTGLRIFMDHRTSCDLEADELNMPLARGVLSLAMIQGELGQVFSDTARGRTEADEITVFKSVGIGIEDLVTTKVAHDRYKDRYNDRYNDRYTRFL